MLNYDQPYRVFLTPCYPACWKVARFAGDSNATCNYFRARVEAEQEAQRRNERSQAGKRGCNERHNHNLG